MARIFFLIPLFVCASAYGATQKQPIVLISIPKTGTYLLNKLVRSLTGVNMKVESYPSNKTFDRLSGNDFVFGHIQPCFMDFLVSKNCRIIFIYRDPRDMTISKAYWIREHERKYWPVALLEGPVSETITKLIDNDLGMASTKQLYEQFLPWMNCPNVYTTTFERLIGSRGGGSDEVQRQEIWNIIDHLGIACSDEIVEKAIKNLFGNSFTFRSGKIGTWKSELSPAQKELFKGTTGQLLIELGYEHSFDW